jgi:hypothetical protein
LFLSSCYDGGLLAEGELREGVHPSAGGTPSSTSTTSEISAPTPASMTTCIQVMDRWNATIRITPSDFESKTGFSFIWEEWTQFPHPTFKGGSEAAYLRFAQLLLTYLEDETTFAFLANNNCFDERLLYTFESGQIGVDTSFRELVHYFYQEDSYPGLSVEDRQRMLGLEEKM